MLAVSLERKTFTKEDVDKVMGTEVASVTEPAFKPGDTVRIRSEDSRVRWRKPHIRTPGYLFGSVGVIDRFLGCFPNPEQEAFFLEKTGNVQPLYLVKFQQKLLWSSSHHDDVEITAEIYEPWIESKDTIDTEPDDANIVVDDSSVPGVIDHGDHVHDSRFETEEESIRRELRHDDEKGMALASVLIQVLLNKDIIESGDIMKVVEMLDSRGKLMYGQKLVVKAWMDPEFKKRLLEDGNKAAEEVGVAASNPNAPTKFVVVENTEDTHHVIVCTLCSCYPSGVLGMAPAWYKSRSYRARTVREPRKVLSEFGLELAAGTKIVVHDSTADCRYMVLPARPAWSQGWTEGELLKIVSRDCLIGVALPKL